jgi:hypothetical protein
MEVGNLSNSYFHSATPGNQLKYMAGIICRQQLLGRYGWQGFRIGSDRS